VKPQRRPIEDAAFWITLLSLGMTLFNLMAAQALFGVSALLWIVVAIGDGVRPAVPAFYLPLLVYVALTLASAAASTDPVKSLIDCKQLVLFLMVPVVARFTRGWRVMTTIDAVIALGAAGALIGVMQFLVFGFESLDKRAVGSLSHYMTYSGVLMLVTVTAIARLLFHPKQWVWPAIAVPALLVALVGTQARNAWIGTMLATTTLLGVRNWRLIAVAPLVAVLGVLVAPANLRDRALSSFDPNHPTNLDRVAMLQIGRDIVRDHPLFGVGPEMIESVYANYRQHYPKAVNPTNPHLHNVPVQIAAERGLPALGAWIWFLVVAGRDLFRQLRQGPAPAVAGAGLAVLVAMVTAGMFEYNFGDSEFLMLFLGLVTLPFAATRTAAPAAIPDRESGSPGAARVQARTAAGNPPARGQSDRSLE